MSEIRSQATPARGELLEHLRDAELPNTYYHQDDSQETPAIRPATSTEAAETALDVVEAAGWSKPRTVNSAAKLDALNPNAVCSFIDSNGITYACTAAEWQMGGFFSMAKPFPTITVHTPGDAG